MHRVNLRSLEDFRRMPPESIGEVICVEFQKNGTLCACVEPRFPDYSNRLDITYRGDGVVQINDGTHMVTYDDHTYYCQRIPLIDRLPVMVKRYIKAVCA